MSLLEGQFRETLKILTYEFVMSVSKMCTLHQGQLPLTKHEIYNRILSIFELDKERHHLDEVLRILQNNYEDEIKNDCFEKDFSFNSSSVQQHSVSKLSSSFEQSDGMGASKSFDSEEKLRKLQMLEERANEITKYNSEAPDNTEIFFKETICSEKKQILSEKLHLKNYKKKQVFFNEYSERKQIMEVEEIPVKLEAQDDQPYVENQEHTLAQLNREKSDEEDGSHVKEEMNEDNSSVVGDDSSVVVQMVNDSSFSEPSQDSSSESLKENHKMNDNQVNTLGRYQIKKKYRSYTEQQRQEAIMLTLDVGLEMAGKILDIPKKNISRWMQRKDRVEKIRGRKPGDPSMEENLTKWIKLNIEQARYLTQTEIRNKAKEFSREKAFKASKGWLEKYFKRNRGISDQLNDLLLLKRAKKEKQIRLISLDLSNL